MPANYIIGNGNDRKVFSVNLRLKDKESLLKEQDLSDIKKQFNGAEVNYIPYSDNMRTQIIKNITGEEKSSIFLIFVFMCLILEEILRKYLRSHEE
jgi:hypothetical protein